MSKPRLLFLSQTLPFPPDGGVKVRTYNVLRQLARGFDITALCFYRWKSGKLQPDVPGNVTALTEFAHVEAFPIPQEHDRGRLVFDHVRSVAQGRVYTAYTYASEAFRLRLASLLRSEWFDLVHADSLDLACYFPMIQSVPIVCVHHDAQSVLLRRRSRMESSLARRLYVGYQARLMEKEERQWCGRVNLNVTVSEVDRRVLAQRAPSGHFLVVPNGVDLTFFQPLSASGGKEITFVGGSTWFPNADAMRYFCKDILPLLSDNGVRPKVTWVGRTSPEERSEFENNHGIRMTGHVPDIRPYVQHTGCYVVPIRVGGGTRIKILDAWAMGRAVVSTSIGCEGLAAVDGHNILIRDEPRAFADAVADVLRNPELQQSLGKAGRSTVEQQYSWDAIGTAMIDEYLALCAQGSIPRL